MKQQKVLKSIERTKHKGTSQNLGKKNNDECYTPADAILKELSRWAALGKFRGKSIICPCDWDIAEGSDIYSITIKFKESGHTLETNSCYAAVESVKYEYYSDRLSFDLFNEEAEKPKMESRELAEGEIEDFLRDKLTCNFLRVLTQYGREWGIRSITASGYDPSTGKGIKFQDVDFTKYDVCITNPPFSLYKEFNEKLVSSGIDFCCLAPLMNRNSVHEAIPLMEGKMYLGYGRHLPVDFENPTPENNYSGVKAVSCDWVASWPEAQDEVDSNNPDMNKDVHYEDYKHDYLNMPMMKMKDDDRPVIKVNSSFPGDYDGWMFGSVSLLDGLNQKLYEWRSGCTSNYYNEMEADDPRNPFATKCTTESLKMQSNGKLAFMGIVFRKRR